MTIESIRAFPKCFTREAWLAQRRSGIGSSDAPAILGVSSFKRNAWTVYCDKLGLAAEDAVFSEAAEWGLLLQDRIIEGYRQRTGREVMSAPSYSVVQSPAVGFMLASPDGFVEANGRGRGVLEVKNVNQRKADDWTDEPPIEYQVQVQHQLAVLGLEWGSIAALIGGQTLVWLDVPRNDRFITTLIDLESEFWLRVQAQSPPPPTGQEATRRAIEALYPRDNGTQIVLPADCARWDEQYVRACEAERLAGQMKDEAANHLRAALGDATTGVLVGGVSYSYKLQQRKAYEVKAASFRKLLRHTK